MGRFPRRASARWLAGGLAALGSLALLDSSGEAAGEAHHINGGGTADISQFGMGVVARSDGSADGHFLCLMAGRSAFVIPSNRSMVVTGRVQAAWVAPELRRAGFSGTARVLLDGRPFEGGIFDFHVQVTAGGPGKATLQLSLIGGPSLPVEQVLSGHISIH